MKEINFLKVFAICLSVSMIGLAGCAPQGSIDPGGVDVQVTGNPIVNWGLQAITNIDFGEIERGLNASSDSGHRFEVSNTGVGPANVFITADSQIVTDAGSSWTFKANCAEDDNGGNIQAYSGSDCAYGLTNTYTEMPTDSTPVLVATCLKYTEREDPSPALTIDQNIFASYVEPITGAQASAQVTLSYVTSEVGGDAPECGGTQGFENLADL